MPAHVTARAALSYPSFRRFQVARCTAIAAAEMQSIAVGWQLYELTHRPLDLGLAGLAQFLPGLVLVPWTGRAADRFRRERILRLCYLGALFCALLLFALDYAHVVSPPLLYAVLLLSGVSRAFVGPASQSLVPLLVHKPHFPNAVAWGAAFFRGATILGPIVGGLLYAWTRAATAVYLSSAVAFAVSSATIGLVRPVQAQASSGGKGIGELLAGFRCVWERRVLLGALSLDLFAVLLGGAVAMLPIYAKEILHVGPSGFGLMRSAPALGAVVVAVTIAFVPLSRRAGPILLLGVAGFGVATMGFGLSRHLALSMFALFCVGAFDMLSVIVRNTVVQLATPDAMRGRVSSVNMLFIGASNELGDFESGLLAQWLGVVPSVVLGGVGSLVIVALWAVGFPELRRIDRLTEVTAEAPVTPGWSPRRQLSTDPS